MKEEEYRQIQIETDSEDVIGEIIIRNNNFIHAHLLTEYIGTDIDDIQQIRNFLDVVEQKMKECPNTKT